ncbi:hypothetical protein PR003_g5262 [Phytophthora rubi]|uniref:Uncharacterized protein n=1 Tax=Phytophthora rubi TaxID=129364 RepID=A0A6A3NYG9_9STRA|nr:hypothetical protein PR001_g5085 [Phytophthora rubi]KAE9045477.1 hypothetical protein PR002_g2206 [Phytophthora rubi]KAE9350682.1 hypothetical protein PR003_g5262 [Phytophthora rubi]
MFPTNRTIGCFCSCLCLWLSRVDQGISNLFKFNLKSGCPMLHCKLCENIVANNKSVKEMGASESN